MTDFSLTIQSFRPSDEADVVGLWRACGLTRPWNDPAKDVARKLTVQPDLFLVGEAEGAIVATLMGGYDGHRGWVNYLAVAPAFQRRGYATAMMREIESRLLAMGCPKINLLVRSDNLAVQSFYESLGFGQDAVISMGKRLIPD
ncbi:MULTISPECIES: GNAT family acetyltransferase [unclassified Bordetella]|uniref:GNAT family acetyltransferase n=1 Tax=unclassified Bordetella TaxID=2630031 RepID=UPI001329F77E|nr:MULTISPECIES: GNAT family acetyltransferase [unclassified Bordetella]MVW72967.1 GNAT family acetyltransferase [Bordetella sp. 15P40C-2]MVW79050.1 GNAT family acetyltransferase [Bordetella sp. 02P26C-1]